MNSHLDALLASFIRLRDPEPANIISFLQKLPDSGVLPSPWNTWTIIGLTRHLKRQNWVAQIIRTRLHGSLADIAAIGALGHPNSVPQSGPVPSMPDWEYYFHGRGCCISHKVDGDAIDVDFYDDSADYFDTFFYKTYLESLRRPEPPEQRIRELHPSIDAVSIAVADLLAIGALIPLPGMDSHSYRLTDEIMDVVDDIDYLCNVWPNLDRRLWHAALIGDWLAADDAADGRPELTAITGPRAKRCREIQWQRLQRELDEQNRAADALRALADLAAPDIDQCLDAILRGPPSGLISAALDVIVQQQDDHRWCGRVHKLFSRVNPAGKIPQPHIWITSLKFLLRHGYYTTKILSSLAKAGGTEIGEAVLLSLEHAPHLALPLIRKGLLADVPTVRTQVAAILALINAPWSRRELLGALEASDDQEKTADVRAVLLESLDEDDKNAVLAWEDRNPHENETGSYLEIGGRRLGPFYTFGELWLKDRTSWIRYETDKLHDRIMKVKNVIPPESPGSRPWWKLWGIR
jgi:hypothetical protein